MRKNIESPSPTSTQQMAQTERADILQRLQKEAAERQQVESQWQQEQEILKALVAAQTSALTQANEQLQQQILERQRVEKALRASEERLQLAIKASCIGIWDWEIATGKVTYSEEVESLLGVSAGTLTDSKDAYCQYIHPDDRQSVTQVLEAAVSTGKDYEIEHRILKPESTTGWLWSKGKVVRDQTGRVVRIVGMLTDITRRKLAEAELYQDINKEKELLERKCRFISMASHDLRTPLATILISSDLLKCFQSKLTPEQKNKQIDRIQSAVQQMTQLLDDILVLGKAESEKQKFKASCFNLENFCRDILAEIEETAGRKVKFDFGCNGACSLVAMEQNLVRQIVINLVYNAVKYSPDNKTVYVKLICENEQAVFQVKDEGIGIPEADRAGLFDVFHRASNVGNISGTGLGMTIVKNAVDLHQGSIKVESQVGIGTTFTVCLPTHPPTGGF